LKPNTKVVAEHRVDDKMIVSCSGSGYVAVQHDDRDQVRIAAIQARRELRKSINEWRAELIADLTTKHWAMAAVVDYYGERLIRTETRAHIWHELALHGDLSISLREAMQVITRNSTGALRTHDVDRCTVAGTRDWLTEARTMLLDLVAQPEQAGDLLSHLMLMGW
jgi:hypothetical protein